MTIKVYFTPDHVREEIPGIRLLGKAKHDVENYSILFLAEAFGPPSIGEELVSYWVSIPRERLEFGAYEQRIHKQYMYYYIKQST